MSTNLDKEFDQEIDLDSEFDQEIDLDSEFDQEESSLQQLVQKEPSFLEESGEIAQDVVTGIAEGTGLGKILSGVTRAAGSLLPEEDTFTDPNTGEVFNIVSPEQSLLDEYYKGKEQFKRQLEESRERSPYITGTGEVAGMIAPGPGMLGAISKSKKLSKLTKLDKLKDTLEKVSKSENILAKGATAATLGAGVGAGQQLLEGEAKTLKGIVEGDFSELDKTAREALTGAAFGGVLGGVGSGVLALGPMFKEKIKESATSKAFKFGKKGISLDTSDDLGREILESSKLAKTIKKDIVKKTDEVGEQIGKKFDNENLNINLEPILNDTDKTLNRMATVSPDIAEDVTKIKDTIKHIRDNSDPSNMSFEEADQVLDAFESLTDFKKASPIISNKTKKIVEETSKNLNSSLKNQVEGLEELYTEYSKLKDLRRNTKMMSDINTLKANKIDSEIDRFADTLIKGDPIKSESKFRQFSRFDEELKETDPKMYDKFKPKLDEVRAKYDIASRIQYKKLSPISKTSNIFAQGIGFVDSNLLSFSNKLGKELQGVSSLSPKIREQFEKLPKRIQDEIIELKNRPKMDRHKALFGLMQQPFMRDFVKSITEEE